MKGMTLAEVLAEKTRESGLFKTLPDGRIECFACGHRCPIPEGRAGICKIRFHQNGKLHVPYGYVAGLQDDPIEKKPFFHALPGARALSFGMLGCDLHCAYCQNWVTSQALRDPVAGTPPVDISPEKIVQVALERQCRVVTSTYNEPLITSEWAVAVFKEAKRAGLVTSYVSNGNATPEILDYIEPWVDLYKVDLKTFNAKNYRQLGTDFQNVTETIRSLAQRDIWLEVLTLLIPGFNNSEKELRELTAFLASVSPDIPWHVTAFHKDYKMTDPENTTTADLIKAGEIGKQAGLRYIYLGNLPGRVGEWENTYCSECRSLLVEREGFTVRQNRLASGQGQCPDCQTPIPGFWAPSSSAGALDGALRPLL